MQSNATYTTYGDLPVSSNDLVNYGQPTLAGYTVSATSDSDETPDRGFITGTAGSNFSDITWFRDDGTRDQLPATITLNLDVTVNTAGYDISQIISYAGFIAGFEQGDQIMTVEYSLVGDAGFTTLGTYSYEDPAVDEFGSISLSDDTTPHLLSGVDALRFTYEDPATADLLVLQEIDVLGTATPLGTIVQSNSTYTAYGELPVSNSDLVNYGQPTLASYTVSATSDSDETPDRGFITGTAGSNFSDITWFRDDGANDQLPATITLNLDVTVNTAGYDISQIISYAGFIAGFEQGDQIMTVEYSLVGDAGFTTLGTYSYEDPAVDEFGSISLSHSTNPYMLSGVDALRFTYEDPATADLLVLQEIDVIGVGEVAPEPPVALGLASMFSDDMILQRDQLVPVWGISDPGASITVEFAGQTQTTVAASNGTWRVDLAAMEASAESRTLTVGAALNSNTAEISFSNVLVGEVWLASGQSNMWWPLWRTDNGPAVVANATHPTLRLFKVPQVETNTPLDRIDTVWTECTPETAEESYGVAYYFARKLQAELNVPVGVIQSAWPGSAIEGWLVGGAYYNGMIAAQIPFALRGMIWYQGESNVRDGMLYVDKQKNLLESWRAQWGYDFPFYYVQLAPFNWKNANDGAIPFFWEAQSAFLDVVPYTGMAVITDTVVDTGDLHPGNKEDPGNRLALLALANTYGFDIVSTGPTFRSLRTVGSSLELSFDSADGLTTRDGLAPDWFELETSDGSYTQAAAVVSNNTVILSSPSVNQPTGMRFAWSEIAQPNLVNGAGLVASSFRVNGAYNFWAASFSLLGVSALYSANPDGDTLNNLAEYASGGNPTNGSDRGYVPITGISVINGTNYFVYAYARRRDADVRGLAYLMESASDLVVPNWSTNSISEAGIGPIDNDFEWVTNQVPVDVKGYMRLIIEFTE